jgi:peptidoglycan/LPS O-acetylase OafA/YrhL
MWSLGAEEQFYAVGPLLLVLAGLRGRSRLALALALSPLAVSAAYGLHLVPLLGPVNGLRLAHLAAIWRDFSVIGAGVVCALYERPIRAAVERAPPWIAPAALAAMVALQFWPSGTANVLVTLATRPALIMTILMGSLKPASPLRPILESRPLQALGAISYSLYLWQELATNDWPGAGWAAYAGLLILLLAIAAASRRWIEKPCIAAGRAWSAQLGATPAPQARGPWQWRPRDIS